MKRKPSSPIIDSPFLSSNQVYNPSSSESSPIYSNPFLPSLVSSVLLVLAAPTPLSPGGRPRNQKKIKQSNSVGREHTFRPAAYLPTAPLPAAYLPFSSRASVSFTQAHFISISRMFFLASWHTLECSLSLPNIQIRTFFL